jgi:hypothetical protein
MHPYPNRGGGLQGAFVPESSMTIVRSPSRDIETPCGALGMYRGDSVTRVELSLDAKKLCFRILPGDARQNDLPASSIALRISVFFPRLEELK